MREPTDPAHGSVVGLQPEVAVVDPVHYRVSGSASDAGPYGGASDALPEATAPHRVRDRS
ncbi:hypothetical protein GCM10009795_046790 [Nocardioides hankookensis]|uniref:Uncharacterized protein n=1 Tax=Nocardioides hankookensis TaxID=443157 RepID=A0ABW1LRT4_9ACTN